MKEGHEDQKKLSKTAYDIVKDRIGYDVSMMAVVNSALFGVTERQAAGILMCGITQLFLMGKIIFKEEHLCPSQPSLDGAQNVMNDQ